MNIEDDLKTDFNQLEIAESEALDSWEDELATTPEDEVSAFNIRINVNHEVKVNCHKPMYFRIIRMVMCWGMVLNSKRKSSRKSLQQSKRIKAKKSTLMLFSLAMLVSCVEMRGVLLGCIECKNVMVST